MERPPTAFISYSWEDDAHREWVRDFAKRLRSDGVDAVLDYWHARPGDELPRFMEAAVRENDFVVVVCTPKYKIKSDNREGGVGYEGAVMTAELFVSGNQRKFIPVLRRGVWSEASPSWLAGKYYVDLSGDVFSENAYEDLISTLRGTRKTAPPIGGSDPDSRPRVVLTSAARGTVLVTITPPTSPNTKEAFDELEEIMLELALDGYRIEEIEGPQNSSIFPLLEYSASAAQAAIHIRERLLPIVAKYRRITGTPIEVRLRMRRPSGTAEDNHMWLHL
jgi:hypothetical protein